MHVNSFSCTTFSTLSLSGSLCAIKSETSVEKFAISNLLHLRCIFKRVKNGIYLRLALKSYLIFIFEDGRLDHSW